MNVSAAAGNTGNGPPRRPDRFWCRRGIAYCKGRGSRLLLDRRILGVRQPVRNEMACSGSWLFHHRGSSSFGNWARGYRREASSASNLPTGRDWRPRIAANSRRFAAPDDLRRFPTPIVAWGSALNAVFPWDQRPVWPTSTAGEGRGVARGASLRETRRSQGSRRVERCQGLLLHRGILEGDLRA